MDSLRRVLLGLTMCLMGTFLMFDVLGAAPRSASGVEPPDSSDKPGAINRKDFEKSPGKYGFSSKGEKKYSAGGASFTVAEYRHDKTGIEFALIPGGAFLMGNPGDLPGLDDESPRHKVALDPFLIARYEVTQAQWQSIMGNNPSKFKDSGKDAPVENVSWTDCSQFCEKAGLRLPSEAQWEYACRAGTDTELYTGKVKDKKYAELDDIAWHSGNSANKTHPVGKKKPNAFGLYDMLGNVSEWCEDDYDAAFYKSAGATAKNPVCRNESKAHVARGGAWDGGPRSYHFAMEYASFDVTIWNVRMTHRHDSFAADLRSNSVGFRPVVPLAE